MKKRWIGLVCAVALLCTGCSLDVESFLQPPKIGGEQQAVQTALETYVRDTAGGGVRFTPEYPMGGEYTAAFTLCDAQGFPVDEGEDPSMAVVFYSLSAAPEETRVNVLRQDENGWVSVADAVGIGTAIYQVAFGDLNGDGTAELITGWKSYNSHAFHLMVYNVADGLAKMSREVLYSALFVGDITAAGHDDLLLLTAGSEVFASLYEMRDNTLTLLDNAMLDKRISQFGDMTLCRLAEGVHGLFLDGYIGNDSTITELLYYKQEELQVPFGSAEDAYTVRAGTMRSRDIDGDGVVEIPTHTVIPGHGAGEVGGFVTLWRGWDYATATWQERGHTLVNEADGYMVTLDENMRSHLDATYDAGRRMLTLLDTDTDTAYLWLLVGEPLAEMPAEGLKPLALLGTKEGHEGYYAYYNPDVISAEKVGYLVSRF